jgi:hypothetical protein
MAGLSQSEDSHASTKSSATRRVWRMLQENQLGEISELPDESNRAQLAGPNPNGRGRAGAAPGLFHDSTGFGSSSTGEPRVSRMMSSANVSSWRASSYDLLQGLTVRDVSEKIPQRTFEALFSADAASCKGDELHEPEITGCRKLGRHRANTCAPLPARRRPRECQHVLQMRRRERGRDCSANGMRHGLCARRKEDVGTQYASNAARCTRPRTFIAGPAAGG